MSETERDPTKDAEAKAVIQVIDSALVFCAAWSLWKQTHDIDALEMNCCKASTALHLSANAFEHSMRKLIMNKSFLAHLFGTELAEVIEKTARVLSEAQDMAEEMAKSRREKHKH